MFETQLLAPWGCALSPFSPFYPTQRVPVLFWDLSTSSPGGNPVPIPVLGDAAWVQGIWGGPGLSPPGFSSPWACSQPLCCE